MRTVLITGGASGLGKELCKMFKNNNYNVLFTYNSAILDNELDGCIGFKCDLKEEEDIHKLLDEIDSKYSVDILVNNAAIEFNTSFDEKTKSDFINVLEVNLIAPFLLSRFFGTKMKERKYGKIINISSNNSIDKFDPITLEYDASKAALNNLTKNLAVEFSPYVMVNAIAPGWILTDKVKSLNESLNNKLEEEEGKKILLNRFATCKDIGNLVLFLASDKSNYINGEIIRIDGGSYDR
ncbi:MAG: SDR family oxidoreductase [Bacilli bacterium]|nr:SDR family oxidoreductase [Bacilli bacterium]